MTEALSLLDACFAEDGPLARSLPSYERREGQEKMAKRIWEAFQGEQTALFEAGTGIGKSLAYLLPSLLWSYKTGEKLVISTYTISLQEQLFEKDLPLIFSALGFDLRVALVKGMGNYLCVRKLQEVSKQEKFFDEGLDKLHQFAKTTWDGTKSALPFPVDGKVWSQVCVENEACSYVKCPHYSQCFFFRSRNSAQDADILIVNHHLLMAHSQAKEGKAILPKFDRLVIDEAHHFEHVAQSSLTQNLDRIDLFQSLARVHTDASSQVSRLYSLCDLVTDKALKRRLEVELPAESCHLFELIHQAFNELDADLSFKERSRRWRITREFLASKIWREKLIPRFQRVQEALVAYSRSLSAIEKEISQELKERVENDLLAISQLAEKLLEKGNLIGVLFDGKEVLFTEQTPHGWALFLARLEVAPFLQEELFNRLKTVVCCSATLSVGGEFDHFRSSLGIKKALFEEVYPSPFDFKGRTRLLGFSDFPAPNSPQFIPMVAETIRKGVAISGGGAFVLFTSYEMLRKTSEMLSDLPHLCQGGLNRHLLLEKFKGEGDGVLFGTDSFWEGVDVPGRALRLLILVKLPFPVPSEPLLEARSEICKLEGKDPFSQESLPQAVMKFKQGFGRLMRHREDRGCVLCLDPRLFTRSYGKTFLASLPECITSFAPKGEIFNEMEKFYGA